MYRIFIFLCLISAPATAQIVLNKSSNMFFGTIGYDTPHSGTITLGTNGNVSIIGGTGLAYNSGAHAGSVMVVGTPMDVVEIKCETSGKMRLGNSNLNVTNIEVAVNSGVAFGAGQRCRGVKRRDTPATTIDLAGTPLPNILMGGEVFVGANSLLSGTYNTTSGGGQAIQLTVIYQ